MSLEIDELHRRGAIALAAAFAGGLISGGGLFVSAATAKAAAKGAPRLQPRDARQEGGDREAAEDVSASEDLMREHGVLRRTLIVYAELAGRLRSNATAVDPGALLEAAKLFREFGEHYHERTLEERYIFPEVRKAGGANEKLVEILLRQHQRGREITDYVSSAAARGQLQSVAGPLADALAGMARMYHAHSAWEDTLIFPAWKQRQSRVRLKELAAKFEDIEHQQFGNDGFEAAVQRIGRIEQQLGLADLAAYTAAPPNA
jgi:hemerythrin-like domain-containing protein